MATWCLLRGHKYEVFAGVGEYAGCDYLVCSHCGHTLQTQFVGMDAPQIQAPVILRPT